MFVSIIFSIGLALFVMILVLKLACTARCNFLEALPDAEDTNERRYLLAVTSSGVLFPIMMIIFEFVMLVLAIDGIISGNKDATFFPLFMIGITTIPIIL